MPRGGKREGAGGKPLDGKARLPVTATLSAELVALLDAAAGVSGRSRSMLVNDAVEAHVGALQAIASGSPVEPSDTSREHGGFRPGSGRRPADEHGATQTVVDLPASIVAKLDQAVARTGRSRSALVAGALALGGHWLEVVGLPVIEAAPAHLAELWLEVDARGSVVVLAAPGERREVKPRDLPTAIWARYQGQRNAHPTPPPDVHLVRDYLSGTWVVGERADGFPMGFYVGAVEAQAGEGEA